MSIMPILPHTFRSFSFYASRALISTNPAERPIAYTGNFHKDYVHFSNCSRRFYVTSSPFPIDKDSRVLDLSSHQLSNETLSSLLDWLKNASEGKRILRIKWNDQGKTDYPELYQKLDEQCVGNRETYRDRPSLGECILLGNLAYKSPEEIEKANMLPSGWQILKCSEGKPVHWNDRENDSYFGTAFINRECRFGIIAHRGTEFSFSLSEIKGLIKDVSADLEEVLGNQVGHQQNSALAFSNQALRILKSKGYNTVGHVGHSLGGWLAQLSVYHQVTEGKEELFAVTLDNPGTASMIKEIASRYDINRKVFLRDLDVSNFLSYPNVVNTCHEHIGDLFHIQSPEIKFSCLAKYSCLFFNIEAHNKECLAQTFDVATGDPLQEHTFSIKDWPCFNQIKLNNELREFFKHATASNDFQPKGLTERDYFWLNKRAHYSVTPYDPTKINLVHFTKKARDFLLNLEDIKHNPNVLQDAKKDLFLPSSMLDFLLHYKLYRSSIGGEIKISPSGQVNTAFEFRRQVNLLLETYPLLIERISFPHLFQELKKDVQELDKRVSFELIERIHIERVHSHENAVDILMNTTQQGFVQRLYLYFNASESEIEEHNETGRKIDLFLSKNTTLSKNLTEKYNADSLSLGVKQEVTKLLGSTENQCYRLRIASSMNDALRFHKIRNYKDAHRLVTQTLNQLEKYKQWYDKHPLESAPKFSLLFARAHSLKAKILRASWSQGDDFLADSRAEYKKAIESFGGEPILYSNLGALLNDWGEWLSYREQEPNDHLALEKHQEALEFHKQAFEMYPTQFGIKRDYGRALFLHAQALFKTNKLPLIEYITSLKEAASHIEEGLNSTPESSSVHNPTAYHFLGLIEIELGDHVPEAETSIEFFKKGLEHCSLGLKTQKPHPVLLYYRAFAKYKFHKATNSLTPDALKESKQDVNQSLQYFRNRRITPEDQYRIVWAYKLLNTISKENNR